MARGGSKSGSELASGYISLSVKYANAMSQVDKDFDALEAKAATSGKAAGENAGKGITSGVESEMKNLSSKTSSAIDTAGIDMSVRANRVGAKVGKGIADAITVPINGLKNVFGVAMDGLGGAAERGTERVTEGFAKMSEGSIEKIGEINPALGGVAETMLTVLGPEGTAIGIALAGIAIVTGAIAAVGDKWEEATSQMSRQTGKFGEDVEGLMDTVKDEMKDIDLPMSALSDATASVVQQLGLTGEPLKNMAEKVAAMQALGAPLDMQSFKGVSNAFKLNGDQESDLADQLLKSKQQTGVAPGALTSTMQATAPILNGQLGLDADGSLGLITKAISAGLSTSALNPALKQANTAAEKAGIPLLDFLKANVQKIQDDAKRGDTVAEAKDSNATFGARGGPALAQAIASGKLNAADFAPAAPGTPAAPAPMASQDQFKDSETIGEKFQGIVNKFETALAPAGKVLMDGISHMVDQFQGWWQKYGPELTNIFQGLMPVFQALGVVVKFAFDGIVGSINIAISVFSTLTDGIRDAVGFIEQNFNPAIKAIGTFFEGLPGKIEGFFEKMPDEIAGFFKDIPGKIVDFFSSIPSLIAKAFTGSPSTGDTPGQANAAIAGGRAGGGAMSAPGPKGRDSAMFWGADGEHILTAHDVDAMGGQAGVYAFRNALHRDGGGAIGPDVTAAMSMDGTPYSQAARNDCSGMVGRVIEAAMGMPGAGGLPTTQNMGQWLAARGFKEGTGGAGSISVGWYNHGSKPNDGHTAMTLSNGMNAESGGSHGNFLIGGAAAGASNAEFDNHMYLPMSALYGEGSAMGGIDPGVGGSSGGGGGATSIPAGSTAGTNAAGQSGFYTPNAGKVTAAQAKLDKDNDDLKKLQDKQKALDPKTDQAKKDKLQAEIDAKNKEIQDAQKKLDDANKGDFTKLAGQKGQAGQAGGAAGQFGQLGDIGMEALTDNLPDGFDNPLNTTLAHAGSGIMGFIGSLVKDPTAKALLGAGSAALGGSGSGVVSSLAGLFTPQDPSESTGAGLAGSANMGAPNIASGNGTGPMPGPAPGATGSPITNNFGPQYNNSPIGHDPAQHAQAVRNDQNATQRGQAFSTQRYGQQG